MRSIALLCTLMASAIALLPYSTSAQIPSRSLEIGAQFGTVAYSGELSQHNYELLEAHKAYSGFLRFNYHKLLSLRLGFLKGEISGQDANFPTIQSMRERNLSFRSKLHELAFLQELNFMEFGSEKRAVARAYLFGGLAATQFNPQALYDGQWHDLHPLRTEEKQYSKVVLALPMGCGFKVLSTRHSCFGVEFGLRKTFTDYLDDVSGQYPDLQKLSERSTLAAALSWRSPEVMKSFAANPAGQQRGDKGNDSYLFGSVHISIIISR